MSAVHITPETALAMPCSMENHSPTESMIDFDGEALPPMTSANYGGLNAREHAAIALRLPDSGNPWLDEMIAKARLLDTATALEAAYITAIGKDDDGGLLEPVEFLHGLASTANEMADALIDEVLTEPSVHYVDGSLATIAADQLRDLARLVGAADYASAVAAIAGLQRAAALSPISAEVATVAEVKAMVIDGKRYREEPENNMHEDGVCGGCAFAGNNPLCTASSTTSRQVFGSTCGTRNVIYLEVK